jgi:hypothetical protein
MFIYFLFIIIIFKYDFDLSNRKILKFKFIISKYLKFVLFRIKII